MAGAYTKHVYISKHSYFFQCSILIYLEKMTENDK